MLTEERKTIYLCLAHMSEEGYEQKYVKEAFDTNWVVPMAPRITLIIRKFYKKHPEKYPLFTFPGVFCLFFCRNSRLTFYF